MHEISCTINFLRAFKRKLIFATQYFMNRLNHSQRVVPKLHLDALYVDIVSLFITEEGTYYIPLLKTRIWMYKSLYICQFFLLFYVLFLKCQTFQKKVKLEFWPHYYLTGFTLTFFPTGHFVKWFLNICTLHVDMTSFFQIQNVEKKNEI